MFPPGSKKIKNALYGLQSVNIEGENVSAYQNSLVNWDGLVDVKSMMADLWIVDYIRLIFYEGSYRWNIPYWLLNKIPITRTNHWLFQMNLKKTPYVYSKVSGIFLDDPQLQQLHTKTCLLEVAAYPSKILIPNNS